MKIVCIGDSLTYGFGVIKSKTWTTISENELNIEIINEGINGDTTGGMISRFNDAVITRKPDIVFIMGGPNDLIAGADLGVVQANVMSMAHQALNKLIMPIIGIPPKMDLENIRKDWALFADFNKIEVELVKYQSWIKDFSKTFNIKYIDFYSGIDNIAESSNLYLDGLHLNDNGQIMMSKLFCNAIKKLNI